ncbi:MAG: extracellular solute-binding protein [Anaerolineae bacterium]|nr:extracellular solute-binding protein [Anaerolineae bacterium]
MGELPIDASVVMEDLLDRFESENPDINVILDNVPLSTIMESLPLQLQTGDGPDIAKVTDIGGLSEYYLDMRPYLTDPGYWEENMQTTINATNPDGLDEINGIYSDVTVTGPFINRTLFEQAGVAVPSDTSDEVTWEEWAEAARQVRDATGVDYAMAMDRSGHRFAGPAVSQGAQFFNEEGYPTIDDEGFRRMAQLMIDWHADGTMPLDVWAGGDSYQDARAEFVNSNLVLYMTGNWQIGPFTDQIGDAFDWEAVPNPCGPAACSGMPGGSVIVGIAATQYPEQVTRLMEFLAAEENYGEWAARANYIPQHEGLIESGIAYETDLPQALNAYTVFGNQTSKLAPLTYELQGYKYNSLLFNSIRDRLTQAIVGELSLDEAIERIQADVDEGLAATGE